MWLANAALSTRTCENSTAASMSASPASSATLAMTVLMLGLNSGRSIGNSKLVLKSSTVMKCPAGAVPRSASARASMPRRMSMMRRFSSQAWSSRKRRNCCDNCATVACACSPASSQS